MIKKETSLAKKREPKKEPKKAFFPELTNLDELESAFVDRPGTPMPSRQKSRRRYVSG